MPDGQAYFGGGAYLRPRDQLKLGQLYLDGGVWNGKRIVSKNWVTESISVHSRFAETYSLGQKHQYGYGWHIHDLKSGVKTYRVFAAEGNGGQVIIVVPDLDLVVGITGGSYGEFDQWIDGSWSLCRSSLSLQLSRLIAIRTARTIVFSRHIGIEKRRRVYECYWAHFAAEIHLSE